MNINIYVDDNLKISYIGDAILEYKKRLSRFTKINILKPLDKLNNFDGESIKYDLVFTTTGEEIDSPGLSLRIKEIMNLKSYFNILIKSKEDYFRYENEIKLTNLFLDYDIELVMALEQIYRAFKIMNNETYHK